jgi:hypothetical protein
MAWRGELGESGNDENGKRKEENSLVASSNHHNFHPSSFRVHPFLISLSKNFILHPLLISSPENFILPPHPDCSPAESMAGLGSTIKEEETPWHESPEAR